VAAYPGFESLCQEIKAMGFEVRLSSLRVEDLDRERLTFLSGLGLRTLTLAPETAGEAVRARLGKKFTNAKLYDLAERASVLSFRKLKLYFLFGLPGETGADLEAIASMLAALAARSGLKVGVSLNLLLPKPQTPMQWAALEEPEELERKRSMLAASVRKQARTTPVIPSIPGCLYQAALSLGGEEVGQVLGSCLRSRSTALRTMASSGVDLDLLLHEEKPFDYKFPWSFLEDSEQREAMYREMLLLRS